MTNEDFDDEYGDDGDDAVAAGDDNNNNGDVAGDDVYQNDDAPAEGDDAENAEGNNNDDNNNSGGGGNENGNDDGGDGGNGNAYDPYTDFDIEQCDTYENLWLWDLSLTCESESSLEACECIFAEQLVDEGLLSCDDMGSCPADCQICRTCFQLMQCGTSNYTSNDNNPPISVMRSSLYVVLAASGIVLFSGVYFLVWRRRRKESDLAAHLILADDTDDDYDYDDTGSHRVGRFFAGSKGLQVWLAPVSASTQFKPSHAAALQATTDEFGSYGANGMLPTHNNPTAMGQQQNEDTNVWLAPVP